MYQKPLIKTINPNDVNEFDIKSDTLCADPPTFYDDEEGCLIDISESPIGEGHIKDILGDS